MVQIRMIFIAFVLLVVQHQGQGSPFPQVDGPTQVTPETHQGQGAAGGIGQFFNGFLAGFTSALQGGIGGANSLFNGFGDAANNTFNGLLTGYNATAQGLVQGATTFIGNTSASR